MADYGRKTSYGRTSYEYSRHSYVDGSAVRKQDDIDLDDLDSFLVDSTVPAREYPTPLERNQNQEVVTEKYVIRFASLPKVIIAIALIVAIVFKAYTIIETKSDINLVEKEITNAKICLDDVNAVNEELMCSLDINLDRNYIYNIAVGKLGMVYPKDNKVVYYDNADSGYVIQYSAIA